MQNGEIAPIAKHMTSLGPGVFELVDRSEGDAYRVICATKLGDVVYVIDAFKKKSRKGRKTPREIIERIEHRLTAARAMEKKG